MDLAQIGLGRVRSNAGAVLHSDPCVGVALYTVASQQGDPVFFNLAEPVFAVAADADHRGLLTVHVVILLVRGTG